MSTFGRMVVPHYAARSATRHRPVGGPMALALQELTVIDLTQVMAGPFCCQLLGDLGADVIKVEPVGRGDATREATGHRLPHGESAAFVAVNRNKRSIAMDLGTDAGHAALRRLVSTADV